MGDFQPQVDDALDEPRQRTLVGQLGAQGGHAWAAGDLAVVKLRADRWAGPSGEADLVCS